MNFGFFFEGIDKMMFSRSMAHLPKGMVWGCYKVELQVRTHQLFSVNTKKSRDSNKIEVQNDFIFLHFFASVSTIQSNL